MEVPASNACIANDDGGPPEPAELIAWSAARPARPRTPAEEDALTRWAVDQHNYIERIKTMCQKLVTKPPIVPPTP